MQFKDININADLGEGYGNDEVIMPLISSCSIACGGHYGNRKTIETALQLSKKYNVKVGAHPSYPDIENFGRKVLDISPTKLTEAVTLQLQLFFSVCDDHNIEVSHIKPHGALYNQAAIDIQTAQAIVTALDFLKKEVSIYTPPNSILGQLAANKYKVIEEAFIDRKYTDKGTLKPRSENNSIISTPEEAWKQLERLYFYKTVITNTGNELPLYAKTFCIHGDHENSLDILKYLHKMLENKNIKVL